MRKGVRVFFLICWVVPAGWAWGAQVHRAITWLALDALPPEAPAWLQSDATRQRLAFQANQPDRWRGSSSLVLKHENDPEHYLDIDDLGQFDLKLESLPKFRGEYLREMAAAKALHPDQMAPYDAGKDAARSQEWPGVLPHAIAEHYAKLQAAFKQVRILEQVNDPARREQLEQARAIAVYELGMLSHFVADAAQPLHTTKHYDGWIGDNPSGYKWREKFHSYVDEGWARRHNWGYPAQRGHLNVTVQVNPEDPWQDFLAHVQRSHAQLEALYALERDGKLDGPEGEKLMAERLDDAASMLSAAIGAAYRSSEPDAKQVESWLHYDSYDPNEYLPSAAVPTSQPAGK